MNEGRILLDATCVPSEGETGASRYVRTLVSVLAKADKKNEYVLFGFVPGLFSDLPGNFSYRVAPKADWLGPAAREFGRRRFISRFLRKNRVDLVHFTLDIAPVKQPGVKTVFTLFDLARLSPHYLGATAGRPLRTALRTRQRYGLARRADCVITTSVASRDAIESKLGIPRERIELTHISPDPVFSPGEPDAEVLRRHGLWKRPYVLFVGQMGRQKNEEGLIAAFRIALSNKRLPRDAALALAGDEEKLSGAAREALGDPELAGRVFLTGRVDDEDLVHLYRGARCMCLPSFEEGFGLPVIEAMACATPVIFSEETSLAELAGPAGIAVDPANAEDLAEKIERLMTDDALRSELSEIAKKRSADFSGEAMAKRHLEIYERVRRQPK